MESYDSKSCDSAASCWTDRSIVTLHRAPSIGLPFDGRSWRLPRASERRRSYGNRGEFGDSAKRESPP